MKKILIAILIATFFLGTGVVNAQGGEKERPEAKNLEIKLKQKISDEDRKKMDEKEMKIIKGEEVLTAETTGEFVLPATGSEDSVEGVKYAIVIGLANYPGIAYDLCVPEAKTPLNYPTKGLTFYCKDDDSVHMRNTLTSKYEFAPENVKWLADANATYGNIEAAVTEIKGKLTAEDELVFFFSGHGFTGESGIENIDDPDTDNPDEFIAIYDSNYNYTGAKYLKTYNYIASNSVISDDEIKSWFAGSSAKMTFIFDICGAGGMNDLAGGNRVLAMSSLEDQSSYTYYLGGTYTSKTTIQESQGLFSHYFVNRGMEDNLGDGVNLASSTSGKASIEEAFGYAYPIIKSTKPQTPMLNDADESLDFLP